MFDEWLLKVPDHGLIRRIVDDNGPILVIMIDTGYYWLRIMIFFGNLRDTPTVGLQDSKPISSTISVEQWTVGSTEWPEPENRTYVAVKGSTTIVTEPWLSMNDDNHVQHG